MPGSTTKTPSGLLISLAILAMSLDEATPTEAVRPPVMSVMSARIVGHALEVAGSKSGPAARSTKASSSDSGSISSDSSRSRSITSRLASR